MLASARCFVPHLVARRHLDRTFASAILVALAATRTWAQTGAIAGTVRIHPGDRPVNAATVRVVGTSFVALTDSAGAFRINSIAAGTYDVEVVRIGILATRKPVTVLSGQSATVTFEVAQAPQEMVGIRVIGAAATAAERYAGSSSIADERTLRTMQPRSANDVLRSLAGVHVQEEEGMGLRANVGVRGLDPDRSRTLLVLEDGVPVALNPYGEPEMYYSPPIERMQRLELLKGSGSILFGPQTVGGVLNYVTADAPLTPQGSLHYQRGTGGAQLARLSYGGTWNGARASVHYFEKSTDDLSGLDMRVRDLTGKIGIPLGGASAGLKFSAYDEMSNATYIGLTDSLFRVNPYSVVAPNDRLRVRRYALTATHEIPVAERGIVRTSAYAYSTTRDWQRQDYSYNATGNGIVFENSTGNRNRSFEVAGIEPRLQLSWGAHELEAGARVHYEGARDQHINGQTGNSRTGVIRDDETRTGSAFSAYVQNRVSLSGKFSLTPGLRAEYFGFERHILRTRVRRQSGSTVTNNPEDVSLRNSDHVAELIPGIGASWVALPGVQLFGGAHRGFAPPRTKDALIYENSTLAPGEQVPVPISLQLDAERSWSFELGTRVTPRSHVSLELTGFVLDFSNQIIAPSLSGGSAAQVAFANQGRTRHAGIEAGAVLDVARMMGAEYSVVLSANYTRTSAAFSAERVMLNADGEEEDVKGNRLPYAPKYRAHAALDFQHPAGVSVRTDMVAAGSQFADNFETVDGSANGRNGLIPAYAVVDVAGTWTLPFARSVELVASVKNVAGKKYIASRRPEGIKAGAPRIFNAGLRYAF